MKTFNLLFLQIIFFTHLFASLSQANSDDAILIGIDADMSSVAAEGGNAILRGAEIAVDEINQSGGVLGRQLELVVKDHRGNPARGLNNLKAFRKLNNLSAVLGGVHTPVVLHELQYIHENQMLFLIPWAAGTPIIENGFDPNFVFRVSVRDSEAASVLIREVQRRQLKKVGLVLERTGWGKSNERSLKEIARKEDVEIVHVSWINWRQKTFVDEIELLSRSNVEAIILVSNAPEGAVALKALQDNSVTQSIPIASHWGIAGGNFKNLIGLELLNQIDLSVLQTFHFGLPRANQEKVNYVLSQYIQKYNPKATHNNILGQVGLAHAYDLIHLLALAIESAGTINSNKVRLALKKLSRYSGLVKQYDAPFAESHDALSGRDYFMARYNREGFLVPRELEHE